MDINNYGVKVLNKNVTFRIPLPYITSSDFEVKVLVIAKYEQFDESVPPLELALNYSPRPNNNTEWGDTPEDLWISEQISLETGLYFYRFEIIKLANKSNSIYFGDPFAKETSSGVFSIFRVPVNNSSFNWSENNFQVPKFNDAIIYELNVAEFNNDFQGIIDRIPYLKSLGVNVVELMPITSIAEASNWGYMPIFYFAPEERFGTMEKLKELVNKLHNAHIAIILDMVYAHVDCMFPYQVGYERFFELKENPYYIDIYGIKHYSSNPLLSKYSNYGQKNEFRRQSTKDFYKLVNEFWINEYHIDGFRYDHVNGYLDTNPWEHGYNNNKWSTYRPEFKALKDLVNATYNYSKSIKRFKNENGSNVIQIVEDLGQASYQLSDISESFVNGCWEEKLLDTSQKMARYNYYDPEFAFQICLKNKKDNKFIFQGTKKVNTETISSFPVQYIECHDKSRLQFIFEKKVVWEEELARDNEHKATPFLNFNFNFRNREWWKSQPYAIGLLTSVGVPMLWAGQEFGENYGLPSDKQLRVRAIRPLHWSYFYSEEEKTGKSVLPLLGLYRKLSKIRNEHALLKLGPQFSKIELENKEKKTLVYRRWNDIGNTIIVVLNFSDIKEKVDVPFGITGIWKELLPGMSTYNKDEKVVNITQTISVDSNFGRILYKA